MKDPKALFPILFASAWLGNLLLTVLAFFLAFSSASPLTPLLFLTVAFCILSGNLLPIGVYLILIRWQAAELAAEKTEADLLLRSALRRSEEILARLDATEGALSKGILMARQVPERIRESLESVENLASRLETVQLESFTETLTAMGGCVEGLQSSIGDIRIAVEPLQAKLADLSKALRTLEKAVAEVKAAPASSDQELALSEKLDLLSESVEELMESVSALAVSVPAPDDLEPALEPEPGPADQPKDERLDEEEVEAAGDREHAPVGVDEDIDVEFEEPVPTAASQPQFEEPVPTAELEVEPESEPEPELQPDPEPPAQEEMTLDLGQAQEPVPNTPSRTTRLVAQAMIGISNRLFVRGDVPWLSWDDGVQMDLIGIGEYAWSIEDLKEPIEVSLLLNDEIPASGGTILLEPGKETRVRPAFPKF